MNCLESNSLNSDDERCITIDYGALPAQYPTPLMGNICLTGSHSSCTTTPITATMASLLRRPSKQHTGVFSGLALGSLDISPEQEALHGSYPFIKMYRDDISSSYSV